MDLLLGVDVFRFRMFVVSLIMDFVYLLMAFMV